ncbi:hypothetical protein SAMN05216360_102450 [Methylobacterium phyllostachyos]|uniref:Uncharacterized protein n=1 Tax=Methylobacterium phyllostachyos TaxID=582672 RepID=A0A1G9U8F8_9HYPH|nr:hypothetical protein [Methylobacterium phyllostachyos]SDM56296.1 hypothetical protein SAMN05216360_102450 [Methylobacterium phyllostachyos]
MERYRSTLGTAAIAAIGLLVAARVLHPGNFEHSPRVARPVQSHAATTSTVAMVRSDPPYGPYMRPGASSPGMAVLAPRLTAPLPAGMTMMPVLPAAMSGPGAAPRETGARRRGKTTMHSVRTGPTVAARARTAQASSSDAESAPIGTPGVVPRDPARDDEG